MRFEAAKVKGKQQSQSKSAPGSVLGRSLRWILLDLPVAVLFGVLLLTLLLRYSYLTYVTPIVQSYKRGEFRDNFYEDYDNEFTYYNRHCGPSDISTSSANDLLIHPEYTADEAADVMLQHGAVAIQNILTNETATELRQYLATKHHHKKELGYNEVFWQEQNRLSLGLGTKDHPIIAKALQEVGSHAVLKRTLEGILGPDPAIVEISTLTSLNGAENQGIHTDSDWFGSSLLYGRTFLHSYSFFIALQDTSQALGATTVCPGTHFCADEDLEDVCLPEYDHDDDEVPPPPSAFEVSTNGRTGKDGMLLKGDAFLFNQNIWHRGPTNVDPDGLDRIMFILTFVTRAKATPCDRRVQGLGTYYYQRWNMWGHSFQDLATAGSTTMVQPVAALGALGIWKPSTQNWGVTWIEQVCQQMANGDEFYADYELDEFREKLLDKYEVPEFLQSQSDEWQVFIPETVDLWVVFATKVYAAAMALYAVLTLLGWCWLLWCSKNAGVNSFGSSYVGTVTKRLFLTHGGVGLVMYGLLWLIDHSYMAKSVQTGEIFVRPFPPAPDLAADESPPNTEMPTTLPERIDVLLGTRYDAEFLASFNRFLDFHPGNKRWNSMVSHVARLPSSLHSPAADAVVHSLLRDRIKGVHARVLHQDYATGAWRVLPESDAVKETKRAVHMKTDPLVHRVATHLKRYLADARFGVSRDTVMAQKIRQKFVEEWMPRVFGEASTTAPKGRPFCHLGPRSLSLQSLWTQPRLFLPPASVGSVNELETGRSTLRNGLGASNERTFEHGDRVLVDYDGVLHEERIIKKLKRDAFGVIDRYGKIGAVDIKDLHQYEALVEGDRVEVDYNGNGRDYFEGVVMKVHPDGRCSILYDDGDFSAGIERENIQPLAK